MNLSTTEWKIIVKTSSCIFNPSELRPGGWHDEQKVDISSIRHETETAAVMSVPRSARNSAPWPPLFEAKPGDWGWDHFYTSVRIRHRRMEFECNRYWPSKYFPVILLQ